MNDKLYIEKFIRDDGAKLEFDATNIYLASENELLRRPDPRTTAVNYTEADGGEMVRQQNPAFSQDINGIIVPNTEDYWTLVSILSGFWQINHTYKIIYKKIDGSRFSVSSTWISSGLQITPVPYENYSYWTVGLTIGNEDWRQYAEDSQGNEIYANSVTIPSLASAEGGEKWDAVGLVADTVGEVWTAGSGGVQSIYIDSVKAIYPIWIVEGECINPEIRDNTTDTVAVYTGTVAAGQTLVVDFEQGVAKLDGSIVSRNLSGILKCVPGSNLLGFTSDGGAADHSVIKWNNVIG